MNHVNRIVMPQLLHRALGVALILTFVTSSYIPSPIRAQTPERSFTVVRDLDSDGKATTKYDLYLPANAEMGKDYALIFFVHGGSFTGGDKHDGRGRGARYASQGIIVSSANYTLMTSLLSHASINSMVEELYHTVDAVVQECNRRGLHVVEMATTGVSAGATLAMLLAYREPERLPVPVRFVFQQVGPVTFDPDLWGADDDDTRAALITLMSGRRISTEQVGSKAYQDAIDSISPVAMVNENTPPTIMAYAPTDQFVPPRLKDLLIEKFKKYNLPYAFINFPNSNHFLDDDPDKKVEYHLTTEEYIKKYFILTHAKSK
ncbi:MAG: alpha/beta hydrolase [Planctomycetia bacterium]|nr:alpha/beta hydrolase [Planctomycetia bacterium]